MDENTRLVWFAIIAVVSPLLAQLVGVWVAVVNRRAAKIESDARFEITKKEISEVKAQGQETHLALNSRLTEMIEKTAGQAKAEGIIQGTQTEQARTAGPQR